MLKSQNLIIIGVVVIGIAIAAWYFMKKNTRENFLNHAFTYKVNREAGVSKGDLFSIPGGQQSLLSPRFSNVDYGAQIRYNTPSYEHMGVPADPLGYSKMLGNGGNTKENYCYQCGGGCRNGSQCNKGGISAEALHPMSQMSQSANYMNSLNNLDYTPTEDLLPVPDMKTMNMAAQALGDIVEQPVVYDRFMYANQKSTLNAQGDPIRGDLPIVPESTGWFRPSVHPQIDLRQGALSVMGGADNSTANALHALQNQASGGIMHALGGIDYSRDTNVQLSNAQRDITVTAFP